jgi:hypothetical protein
MMDVKLWTADQRLFTTLRQWLPGYFGLGIINNLNSMREICQTLKISKATLYRYIKPRGK